MNSHSRPSRQAAESRLLAWVLLVAVSMLSSCALPRAAAPRPMEISGVLRDFDVDGGFFYLEDEDHHQRRAVYWDDSTQFLQKGHEVMPRKAGSLVGEDVAVMAVPMGRKMVANVVDDS